MFVGGDKGTYGTILDNCSTDNYVRDDVARKQKLSEKFVLRLKEYVVLSMGGE